MSAAQVGPDSPFRRALGKYRTTGQPVHRGSYDANDKRAQIARPINALFAKAWMVTMRKWARLKRRPGRAHDLTLNMIEIAQAIFSAMHYASGRCEITLDEIMKRADLSRATIVKGLRRLNDFGFIDWVRRTEPTGNKPGEGPMVKQAPNAYFFEVSRLPTEARLEFRQFMKKAGAPVREHPERKGSGLVPTRTQRLIGGITRIVQGKTRSDRLASPDTMAALDARLNAAPIEEWPEIVFPGDHAAQKEYAQALGLSSWQSASLGCAPQSPP